MAGLNTSAASIAKCHSAGVGSSLHLPLLAGGDMAFPRPLETFSLPNMLSDGDFSHIILAPHPFVIPFAAKGSPRCCIQQPDASFLFWIGRKQCPYPAFLVMAGMETVALWPTHWAIFLR